VDLKILYLLTAKARFSRKMSEYHRPDAKVIQSLKDIANKLRVHSILATNASNSGHPSSCCSAAEIMSTLFFYAMKFKVDKPSDPANDRFVLSKGHAAPILYAAWAEAGYLKTSDLLNLRKIDSDLEGHPTPRLSFVDVATGSLGQGLSCAAGMAYVGKYIDKASYRVYCLIGDGESAEGSIWEALHFSSHNKLDNLVAIFDINRLGQSEATSMQHDLDAYQKRLESFGWNTYVVDGHDVDALCRALYESSKVNNKPSCILAKTFKGKGIPSVEDASDWHGKPLGSSMTEPAIASIEGQISNKGPHGLRPGTPADNIKDIAFGGLKMSAPPNYKLGDKVATRLAYGTALAKLGKNNPRVIGLDGDTKNSTFSIKLKEMNPAQFIECFIAEQNLVGVAIGCATRNRTVTFASTFACFLSRAYDQIRMGAISQTNANFCGSHAGISIGEDGPSQMALEDIAMFRAVAGSTVFYPSDAVSTERAVELAANTEGICFIRTSRPNVAVIYSNDEKFEVGKAKVVRQSNKDQATVIGACVTLVEALKAANELSSSGIEIRVIDPFTIKPLDVDTILQSAQLTGGRVVVVEDHYYEGGIGDAVSSALSGVRDIVVKRLAVSGVPRSGKPEELMRVFNIDAQAIAAAVKEVLKM
jgi:transketolase